MYRVFEVPDGEKKGYEIFWCPSAPYHYADKVPYDGKIYAQRQAAYRRKAKLEEKLDQKRGLLPGPKVTTFEKPE